LEACLETYQALEEVRACEVVRPARNSLPENTPVAVILFLVEISDSISTQRITKIFKLHQLS
jgi:hypothetical protein